MSSTIVTRVWNHSQQEKTRLVAMLAFADQADDDGVCGRIAITESDVDSEDDNTGGKFRYLTHKIRASRSQAFVVIKALEDAGELFIEHNGGRHQVNRYLVTVGRSFDEIRLILVRRFGMNFDDATSATEELFRKDAAKNNPENQTVFARVTENRPETRTVSQNGEKTNSPETRTVSKDKNQNSPENQTVLLPKTVRKTGQTVRKTRPLINGINNNLKDSKTEDSEFGRIVTLYAENIDPNFTPADADLLADTYDTLTPLGGETRYGWFEFAILGACEENVRKWPYVEKILKNISDSGSLGRHQAARNESPEPVRKSTNGTSSPAAFPPPQTPDLETWQAILNTLKSQMPKAMFGNYTGTYPVGRLGSVMVVAAPNGLNLQWLQARLLDSTNRVAEAMEPGLTIKFVLVDRQVA